MGVLPQPLTDAPTLPAPPPPPTTVPVSVATTVVIEPVSEPVADHVEGDRVLLIGDSMLASAAPRNDGLMCVALTLFGWDTEIDAEAGQELDFLEQVLDARFDPDGGDDWDVIGIMFGSNSTAPIPDWQRRIGEALDAVITRVAPRPVVLFTLPVVDIGLGGAQRRDPRSTRRRTPTRW